MNLDGSIAISIESLGKDTGDLLSPPLNDNEEVARCVYSET